MLKHTLPPLPYEYAALEPYIDGETMRIHHDKHHQAYVDKLNLALEKHPELQEKNVEELLRNLGLVPEDVRTAVQNHGGGHYNHSLFWAFLKKEVALKGEISRALEKDFGSVEKFREEFQNAAMNLFGSGWAWLVSDARKLRVITTVNQICPISQGMVPLLTIDIWEHAYYLKYQNRRAEYVENFWNVVNWEEVERRMNSSQ